MSETLITCPTCKTEFPLTESLAAPLVESTRRQYEQKLAQKETDVSRREAAIAKERESLDEKLASRLKTERERIWITEPRCAIPVAIALRQSLIELAGARQTGAGQQTKMELVYQYLTGPRFRHRVEAIVEKFSDMQADLDRERKTMTRLWAKREEQIRGVIESTAGMYGDLQGIAGRTLQEIEGLAQPALEDAKAP